MTSKPGTPRGRGHLEKVRGFYDRESSRYATQRYGTAEPQVARPYLERMGIVLELFDADGGTVLDLGCGPGVLEPHLLDRGCRVVGLDLSPRMAARAKAEIAGHRECRRASFVAGCAQALPFSDRAFDAVVCIGVVSYWPGLSGGLREIARVLRPGGTLVVQATHPLAPWEIFDVSLRSPYHRAAGWITGRDLRDSDFPLRRYLPSSLAGALRDQGLDPIEKRHYDFRAPFVEQIAPRLASRIATRMLASASRSTLGFLGTGYVLKASRREER